MEIYEISKFNSMIIPLIGKKSLDIFAMPEYAKALGLSDEQCFYMCNEDKLILVALYSKLFFKYAAFLSEVQCFRDSDAEDKEFLNECISVLQFKFKVQWINQTNTCSLYSSYPEGARIIPFASYVLDLNSTEEELFGKMHSKHRNVVRRAMKEKVKIVFGKRDLLNNYMEIDNETWERSGLKSRGYKYYETLIDEIDNIIVAIAYDSDGEPQAGAIVPYSTLKGYYLHGCSKNKSVLGASNLLQWEIIKELRSLKVNSYDFAGCRIDEDENSKYHNIQRFKGRFGGELRYGYMFKCVFSKTAYKLYRKMIYIRDKKEYLDVIDQESAKWKDNKIEEFFSGKNEKGAKND